MSTSVLIQEHKVSCEYFHLKMKGYFPFIKVYFSRIMEEKKKRMSDKFCLKWNDFQSSVSHSFSKLRAESHFNDVTLVSEDRIQIAAHKVVLSASSSFFKQILIDNPHANPLLYLGGIPSTYLTLILDYIYQGEVQIYQEHLDGFLEMAQRLKIEGLLSNNHRVEDQDFDIKSETEPINVIEQIPPRKDASLKEKIVTGNPNKNVKVNFALDTVSHDKDYVAQKIEELYMRLEDGQYQCHTCGKNMNHGGAMKRHVETHIDGLSYNCQQCGKTFRSKNALMSHRSIFHK